MADLKAWRNAISDWWNGMTTPVGSFQTRITRTPGVFTQNLPQGVGGLYNNGSIQARPDASPEVLRHESLHSLFDMGSFGANSNQIAPLVSSEWKNYLQQSPTYQKEIAAEGLNPILANEGAAMDISKGTASKDLMNYLMQHLDKNSAAQIQRLWSNSQVDPANKFYRSGRGGL